MKKKLISALITLCLTATILVGATMAYYSDKANELVNTFTVGNIDIVVTEPDWDPKNGEDLVPGAVVQKNPMITNTGASAGYLMLKIEGMDEMATMGFVAMTGDAEGYNTADWVLVDENGSVIENPNNMLVDGYYVYIGKTDANVENAGTVDSGKTTSALFTAVKLSEDAVERTDLAYQVVGNVEIDNETKQPVVKYTINNVSGQEFDTYEEAEAYVMEYYSDEATYVFDLTVQGYAIQAKNIAFQEEGVYTWVNMLLEETSE
uniref:TasA family protein n=1 Tax=Acetatifactor sp. TaxID=1872090 RepID=UPI0040561216